MKKLLALLMAVVMVLGLVACTPTPADPTTTAPNNEPDATTTAPTTTEAPGVEFPLEEEVTLVMTASPRGTVINLQKNLADNKLWNELQERTNVKIEIKVCANVDTLTSLLQTDNYGDIILTGSIGGMNETVLSDLISTDKLLDLTDLATNRNLMPNFNERVLDVEPYAMSCFTSPDGRVYVLGTHVEGDYKYLESSVWINKTWLDDAGMTVEDLSTLEGLEEWFAWIMENDCNGNGDTTDELPYAAYMLGGNMIEALLGMWGIPTKDQTNEGYVFLEDGEVKFAPLTQNWIDFMTTMRKWMENGWIYEDYALGHDGDGQPLYEYRQNTYIRDNGEPERVAMWTGTGAPARNTGKNLPEGTELCEYISIVPPKVEGYETRWYMNPGLYGTKGTFAIASNCEHPEIALAWMDQFYSQEVYVRNDIGEEGTDWVVVDADGKVSAASLDNVQQAEILETTNNRLDQIFANLPSAIVMSDYDEALTWTESDQKKLDAYEKYKDFINTEIWPRPYYDAEGSEAMTEIFGDVATVVNAYRAAVLTGEKNLTSDYETFKAELEQARIDEFIEILQEAYDAFLVNAPQE